MSTFTLSRPNRTPITRWEDWTPPKEVYHWKPGRSAMELAKAWFRRPAPSAPAELSNLLASSKRLKRLKLASGVPEHVTSLPERGEGRNHDLWLLGQTAAGQVTVCVEAKADEPFGSHTVAEYRAAAETRKKKGESTKVPERIDQLLALVPKAGPAWDGIRYQLLTAICGTAIQAGRDKSTLAVLVVHEFHTKETTPENIKVNKDAFDDFMAAVGATAKPAKAGVLYGPVVVGDVEVLIGKAVKKMG